MAEVYLAEQVSLRRQVALKVLLPHLAADATYVERFRREAQSAAALVHANIVQVHEVGRVGDTHYIAQEYVNGPNLREYLARNGNLSAEQAISILRQATAALAKAATQGIVHRDIKPENIMLTAAGEVKVADFGLARVLNDTALTLTQVGMTMGTPLYMSPEQFEGRPIDPRSDLYSLGATAYHMLSGRPPFEAETTLGVAVLHLQSAPPPLDECRPDLPPGLCDVVMRMLAKDPANRFASARELLRDLNALQPFDGEANWSTVTATGDDHAPAPATLAATQHLATVLASAAKRDGHVARRRRYAVAAALLLSAALVGFVAGRQAGPRFLLADADPRRTHVAAQDNVVDQLFYASALNTEDGWLSIEEYFPDELFYVRLAEQQLARLYLHNRDYKRAEEIFAQFAALDDTEPNFKAFGLAGLCVIHSLENEPRQSADALSKLYPLRQHLDRQMRALLAMSIERNQQSLNPDRVEGWKQWFAEQPAPDDGDDSRPVGD